MIQMRADVHVYSDRLSDTQIRDALLIPCPNIEKRLGGLLERYGPQASVCVLPEGPQTVPVPPSRDE
jgi:lactate racemase